MLREKIHQLRGEGYSYNAISKLLRCSKSTINYHLVLGAKEKILARNKRYKWKKKVDEYNQEVKTAGQVKTASQIGTPSLDTDKDMVQIPRKEYEGLMNQVVEGFGNNVDEQFNQLLLYIFTGVFFVVMMDTMYQLGKKSY